MRRGCLTVALSELRSESEDIVLVEVGPPAVAVAVAVAVVAAAALR